MFYFIINLKLNIEFISEFLCPITKDLMKDPVIMNGNIYERNDITEVSHILFFYFFSLLIFSGLSKVIIEIL
jgi:hypothetical protein